MQFSVVASLLLLAVSTVSAVYQPTLQTLQQNDIHVLQYALILENLEYAFYTKYQAQFSAQDFVNAGFTAADYSYFGMIQQHELAHVLLLNSTVPAPTTSCTYNFGVNNVAQYVALARILENTGVSAYDGAINNFYNPELVEIAATIATIEGRHASYLNNLNGVSPFPSAFDTALNSTTIADIIFGGTNPLAACQLAAGFSLPQLYIVYPVQNSSDASQPTPTELAGNDLKVLQYALFLENLEAAFYQYVLSTFNASQLGGNTTYLQMIASHEMTHVQTLQSVIQPYATPIPACNYNFSGVIGTNNVTALNVAAALENTGVGAYDGAANAINSAFYKQVAATIVTVEARHSSYINYLVKNAQGPVNGLGGSGSTAGAFDLAYNFSTTYGLVISTNLIISCPTLPTAFDILVVNPYTNSTFNPQSTSSTTGTTSAAATTSTTGTVTATGTTGSAAATATATGASSTSSRTASTTARTSSASTAIASVVVTLLVAIAAL